MTNNIFLYLYIFSRKFICSVIKKYSIKMDYFVSYNSLHLYFDEKGFNRKNCIIKDEKQHDIFFTSELNQTILKNYWQIFYCKARIVTKVHDKTGKEVLRFIRHRNGKVR